MAEFSMEAMMRAAKDGNESIMRAQMVALIDGMLPHMQTAVGALAGARMALEMNEPDLALSLLTQGLSGLDTLAKLAASVEGGHG